jgi:vacuolar-type H+-ATPase subunit F/Vma7
MREKLNFLRDEIVSELQLFRENNGNVTLGFFNSDELRHFVRDSYTMRCQRRSWDDSDFDNLFNIVKEELRAVTQITVGASKALTGHRPQTWLNKDRENIIGWEGNGLNTYRERYFEYLRRMERPERVLNETKSSSMNIVRKLGDPESTNPFYVKGMVIGSVQSGKTANFNAVINSAVDVGYKLIIVMSGIMEDLRKQTQERIIKEVIGPQIGGEYIGVGAINFFNTTNGDRVLRSITSEDFEFNRNRVDPLAFSLHEYNIIVCKKNVSVLQNILLWLSDFRNGQELLNVPLLIVDDECDNASLNNMGARGGRYASVINKEIRAILNLFSKKTYLGYTATPFANLLQYREQAFAENVLSFTVNNQPYEFSITGDLFPEDFIELLSPPSNYVGIKQFFETRNEKIRKIDQLVAPHLHLDDYYGAFPARVSRQDGSIPVRVDDFDMPSRSVKPTDPFPQFLPNSLKDAVKCFIITIALRKLRSETPGIMASNLYQPHHTMLIHVSRFSNWQNRTKKLLQEYYNELVNQITNAPFTDNVFDDLERVWTRYYHDIVHNILQYLPQGYVDPYMFPSDFISVRNYIPSAAENIEIMALNTTTKSTDNLDFRVKVAGNGVKSGKKYIAIGGNRLSRGFTLEGLTISYFIRGTENADTLMQMGRWFGYRPGYLDCCKLFTTRESIEKFDQSSLIIEDLEEKFEQMEKEGKTPREFNLWILNNPDIIKLTRGSFLRGLTTMSLSFADTVQQSTQFRMDRNKIISAAEAFRSIASTRTWSSDLPGYYTFDTDQTGLWEFLSIENSMINLNTLGLREFLNNCAESNKMTNWKIVVKRNRMGTGSGNVYSTDITGLPDSIVSSIRRGPKEASQRESLIQHNIFKARNSTIITAKDFSVTLSSSEITEAESAFRLMKTEKFRQEGLSEEEIIQKLNNISYPDRAYRSKMDDTTGILMIYLIDLEKVFESTENEIDNELIDYASQKDLLGLNVPLIGYALGFPCEIRGVDQNTYVVREVIKEPQDMNQQELLVKLIEKGFDPEVLETKTKDQLIALLQGKEEADEDADEFAADDDTDEFTTAVVPEEE